LHLSTRSKKLFGFYPEERMNLEEVLFQVADSLQGRIPMAIEQAAITIGPYDESHQVVGFHDHHTRW